MAKPGGSGEIAFVEADSLAEKVGLAPGDRVVGANGRPIRDQIDYRFLVADEVVELEIEADGERGFVEFEKHPDAGLGIEFTDSAFDGTRICNNKCFFCFLKGLPKGLRKTLYVKDDDYRLSFEHGNFVTLTNLSEDDWQRLREQRLSPLHISVHATNSALRRLLLGNPHAPDIRAQLRDLAEWGIDAHTQVVLCPGVNDGAALDDTVSELILPCQRAQRGGRAGGGKRRRGGARGPTRLCGTGRGGGNAGGDPSGGAECPAAVEPLAAQSGAGWTAGRSLRVGRVLSARSGAHPLGQGLRRLPAVGRTVLAWCGR